MALHAVTPSYSINNGEWLKTYIVDKFHEFALGAVFDISQESLYMSMIMRHNAKGQYLVHNQ